MVRRDNPPVRLDAARFDEGDLDAERLDLHPEGVGECLDGEFGDMVPSPEIEHDLAGDGRDVDDGSAPLLPHVRQDELRQPGQAEDINLQLPAGFFDGHVLDGAEGAVTGIVDQDVDPASMTAVS